MTNSKGTGRPKTQYDIDEINEIIEMKLKSVDYDLSKLSYNSVFKFNQYLVSKKKRNSKKHLFNQYGYSFWAADYKGSPNYGKEQIDLRKQHINPIIAGERMEIGTDDIETIIDNNISNPFKMKRILLKIFEKERKNNAHNDQKFDEMQRNVNTYKKLADQYKKALFMMFFNSRYSDNSLNDVITLKKEGDAYIQKEILNIFEDNSILFEEITSNGRNTQLEELNKSLKDNIYDLSNVLSKKKT